MVRKLCLVAILWTALISSARADPAFDYDDLQKTLAAPQITVGDFELARDELNAFYASRDYRPAWNLSGEDNSAAYLAFLDSIGQLIDYHGLQGGDYPLDLMRGLASAADDESRAKLELLTTDTLLHLAHDLHGDAVDLDDLYPGWNYHRNDIDIPKALAAAVASNGLNEFIDDLTPKNPAYRQLAQALRAYRAIAAAQGGRWPKIDSGPVLRPKDSGPRVAQLRARLIAENYLPPLSLPEKENNFFGEELRKAVIAYQLRNGLAANGVIGPHALAALDVPLQARIDQILANMERWRHMPENFPADSYVLVNIPDASIGIVEDGSPVYRGIVIVGQVERKTPFIQSVIRSLIINPAWHVPAKIARKDILPLLRKDPHYLEKLGFVIHGSTTDPHGEAIDWKAMPDDEFNFRLRQAPGKMNSLGRLKFDFDNDFAVYLHGTPHQELFRKNARALSSGCVRLRDPAQVAAILLKDNKGDWDIKHIEDAINSGKTHWMAIAHPLPIYILYWTVFADENGQINFRADVYDYDRFLMQNLRQEGAAEPPDAAPQPAPSP